ncbi:hypothetical protein [Rhodococcus aetherivorans]|uniref:hypothetical protein n=1 Tax=Rhodococcus aetherivorans TaxID=191292 RepID=UPI0002D22C4F|nr:hypothetical protein [Rhodococcus aetherivorans]CCW15279.1 hypothetical protein EBESD8_58510 [Rhodococcus aetherivorans]
MTTPAPVQTLELPDQWCDYNGCTTEATHTDGEWVMCPHHEERAYRTTTYWRPILRWTTRPDPHWPVFIAEY